MIKFIQNITLYRINYVGEASSFPSLRRSDLNTCRGVTQTSALRRLDQKNQNKKGEKTNENKTRETELH